MNTTAVKPQRNKRHVTLSKTDHKAFTKAVDSFHSFTDAAEHFGIQRNTLNLVMANYPVSLASIQKIVDKLNSNN